jgi:hypothetical protein
MKEIKELIEALGYEFESEDKLQRKTRYRSEDGFIDVWQNKKGRITVGIYNPKTKQIYYSRDRNLIEIEKKINEIKKYE